MDKTAKHCAALVELMALYNATLKAEEGKQTYLLRNIRRTRDVVLEGYPATATLLVTKTSVLLEMPDGLCEVIYPLT